MRLTEMKTLLRILCSIAALIGSIILAAVAIATILAFATIFVVVLVPVALVFIAYVVYGMIIEDLTNK